LRVKRAARKGRRARRGTGGTRVAALDAALRTALQALIVSVADRAAEQVTRGWRGDPAAAVLLASAEESRARGERAKREFETVFGVGTEREPAAPGAGFDRSSPGLAPRATRAVSAWQDQLMRLVQAESLVKRAGGATYDVEPLSLVTLVAMLGEDGDTSDGEVVAIPAELLVSALGAAGSKEIIDKARGDLSDRVRLLLDEELLRFIEILDQAGAVDPVAAVRLYQAEYSLEAAR
jgi:hypothetical protein